MNTTTKPRDRTDAKREHALTIYITDPSIKELFTKVSGQDLRLIIGTGRPARKA